jgi:H+-transporting ATPase
VPFILPPFLTYLPVVDDRKAVDNKKGIQGSDQRTIEDAATMDVLYVDKTGTITMNQLGVTGVIPLENAKEADVLFAGALALQEAN